MQERSDRRIEALLDRDEITAVLHCYARGIDRVGRELARSCCHPDAELDFRIYSGIAQEVFDAKARGEAESGAGSWAELTMHYLTNIAIELDGNVAHSKAYCLAFQRTRATSAEIGFRAADPASEIAGVPRDIFTGSRYVDRFERRTDRRRRIARRTAVWEWTQIEPSGNRWWSLVPMQGSWMTTAADPVRTRRRTNGTSGSAFRLTRCAEDAQESASEAPHKTVVHVPY
jgi:SnoaL-like domain